MDRDGGQRRPQAPDRRSRAVPSQGEPRDLDPVWLRVRRGNSGGSESRRSDPDGQAQAHRRRRKGRLAHPYRRHKRMTTTKTKTYHADVVGSLLRSKKLLDARNAMRAGNMPYPEYRAIEDEALDDAIKLQENVGLDVVTDGELRRDIYFGWWVSGMDGMSMIPGE